jgi:imidazolonepropionase-like amidohydrolase
MRLALAGGTIYPIAHEEPLRDSVVLIDGGKIAEIGNVAIPPGVETLDCSGLTIAPAFTNHHVHFFERKWADAASIPAAELTRQLYETFTRYGFTSVQDLGSPWPNTRIIRDRIESGEVAGPRIRSTGAGLVPRGMMPPDVVLNLMGVVKFPFPEISTADDAANAARALIDEGVDAIKLFALSEEAIKAAVEVAHAAGKRVFMHPNSTDDVLHALRNGVDVIAHTTPHSAPWEFALEREVALTPTLALRHVFSRHDRISKQEELVANELAQLRHWIRAGGKVLFGTDLGAVDPDPALEYQLMSDAGMSFRDILGSLTESRLERGAPADLVVFRELHDVRHVFTPSEPGRGGPPPSRPRCGW